MKSKKTRKRIVFLVSALFATILTFFGGAKLLIYVLLFLSGLFVGFKFRELLSVYRDWKLSLRVNSIQFSMRETEAMREKLKQLESDLQTANERMKLYAAVQQSSMRGGVPFDNQFSDGSAGVRQNPIFDREGLSGE